MKSLLMCLSDQFFTTLKGFKGIQKYQRFQKGKARGIQLFKGLFDFKYYIF